MAEAATENPGKGREEPSNEIAEKKQKSRSYALFEQSSYSAMIAIADNYVAPFALAIKATVSQFGILRSVPQVVAALFQLLSVELTDKTRLRKKYILYALILQIASWIPMIFCALFFRNIWFLIILSCIYTMAEAFIAPPYSSWMNDLVQPNERGIFWGKVKKAFGILNIMSLVAAGFILNYFSATDKFIGFAILFGIAFVARVVSLTFTYLMFEPEYKVKPESYFSLVSFLKRAPENNYGRFSLFMAAMWLAMSFGGSFFVVHLINDIHFSYVQYTAIIIFGTIATYFTMPYWGKYGDKIGNKKIIYLTGFFASIKPLGWILFNSFPMLLVYQIFSSFMEGGFLLSTSNYIYDAVTPQRTARCVSFLNFLKMIGAFIGTFLGGIIAPVLPFGFFLHYPLHTLFLLSLILRLAVFFFFMPRIREVREAVEPTEDDIYFRLAALEPTKELISGVQSTFMIGIRHLHTAKRLVSRGFVNIETIMDLTNRNRKKGK